jgi:NitT/TauT family transport system substrate-binding protein
MKKSILLFTAFVLAAAFTISGCSAVSIPDGNSVHVSVVTLKGPTGMGMAKLMEDPNTGALDLDFSLAGTPDEAAAKFISKEADIAAVPVNLASVLYNKTEGQAVMLAVNTLGVLYVLESGSEVSSIQDLSGKTLIASGMGSTPEYLLDYLLERNGIADKVTVEYKAEHTEVAALLVLGKAKLAMLPEPNVSAALAKNPGLRVALDLTEEWNKISDTALVQGCIIARKDFVEENPSAVSEFLNAYRASAEFVNSDPKEASALIEKFGILPDAASAEKAIPGCSIVCVTGEEMKTAAGSMLEVLFEANPKSVGGSLPDDGFYYLP